MEARTALVNFARGVTKASGHRLPSGSSHQFAGTRSSPAVPLWRWRPALLPVLDAIEKLSAAIEEHDKTIVTLASQRYPETRWLEQVPRA